MWMHPLPATPGNMLNVFADDGLKYYDQAVGSGEMAEKGKKVKVGLTSASISGLFHIS